LVSSCIVQSKVEFLINGLTTIFVYFEYSGGTGRVNDTLGEFTNGELTTFKALMSLTHLISGYDVKVLRLNNVANNILQAVTTYNEASLADVWIISLRTI
jgi:hypothetical protein